ncbi:hypothetical protein [Streptomyces celluloflavus]|uniref:hypothetical protein n=1 Tax=Streptomyces celluloflavus TaxID=58344 RepID=UPI00345F997C|nr:hypothetical protein OG717_15355 [Streptomyces celluloflavus]
MMRPGGDGTGAVPFTSAVRQLVTHVTHVIPATPARPTATPSATGHTVPHPWIDPHHRIHRVHPTHRIHPNPCHPLSHPHRPHGGTARKGARDE